MVELSVGAVPSRASWRDLRVKRSTWQPLPLSPWPPPPSRWDLEGPAPFSLPPINRGVRGGQPRPPSKAQPSPPQHLSSSVVCSAKPCRSTASPPSPRRRAAGGAVFLNLSCPLPGPRRRRRRPSRTCVERGGAVRSARGHRRFESRRVRLHHQCSLEHFRSRSTRVCRCTLLSLLDDSIDRSW